MSRKILLSIIFLICFAGSCDKPLFVVSYLRLDVMNKTDRFVIILFSNIYPDTSIPDTYDQEAIGIKPQTTTFKDYSEKKWQNVFDKLPRDTLSMFVFSTDTIQKYGWEKVRNDHNILKRYDLSLQDLERTN